MCSVNVWTVLVASIAAFVVGGLWYSPKGFLNVWLKESGMKKPKDGHGASTYVVALVYYIIAAVGFGCIAKDQTLWPTICLGLTVGVCFAAASFGINYRFAGKSNRLFLIDGGYHAVHFLVYGLVFGFWP